MPPAFNAQGDAVLTFGRNPNAHFATSWVLYRSIDLMNWEEIYQFDGIQIFDSSDVSATAGTNSFEVIDLNPPFPKAFYQFRAVLP